ncbi:MAG: NAD-dependent epimerase/dehydratase family protein [Candidatus Dojkabacteria bacterium]|nr:NAD-dependent epimerase/dehydratase family protein [Candidatus Dojkabacteria bacterium]
MPILEKVSKNRNIPVALIYKGANVLGAELVKLLMDQGAFVIVIDEYSKTNREIIEPVADNELFSFVEISGTESLIDSISRVDYIFYMNNKSVDPEEIISTSDFLRNSNRLDKLLQLGVEKKSKFLLVSSLKLEQILQSRKDDSFDSSHDLSYTVIEIQRYAENLTWEYYKQGGLNARIVRMGEIIGKGINLDESSIVNTYIKNAINGEKLIVEGDGLENLYFVHVFDAAYGLVKAQFTNNTEGGLYALYIPRDITVLNLAYKIMDLEPRAAGIEFVEKKAKTHMGIFDPGKNLKSIGWKPKVSLERSLAQTIDYAYNYFGKTKPTDQAHKEINREKIQGHKKTKKTLFGSLRDFFFEVKEEEVPDSVLDNVQYSSYTKKALGTNSTSKGSSRVLLLSKENEQTDKKFSTRSPKSLIKKRLSVTSLISRLKLSSLLLTTVIFVIFLFFYVFLFAPGIRSLFLSKEVFDLTNKISSDLEEQDYKGAERDFASVIDSIESLDKNLARLDYISKWGLYSGIDQYREDMINSKDIFEGSNSLVQPLAELQLFVSNYQMNVALNGSEDLTLTSNSYDYNFTKLKDIRKNYSFGLRMISVDPPAFSESSTNLPIIGAKLTEFHDNVVDIRQQMKTSSDILQATPSLLGIDDQQTFAVILSNEEKITSWGGELEAVGVISIEDGVIKKVSTYSKDELILSLDKDQENLMKSQLGVLYPQEGLSFESLSRIPDKETFISMVNSSIEMKYATSPDHLIFINFSTIEDIVSMGGVVELTGVGTLNASNFNQVIRGGEVSYKELMAKILLKMLALNEKNSSDLLKILQQNSVGNNAEILTHDESVREFFADANLGSDDLEQSDQIEMSFVSDSGTGPLEVQVNLSSVIVNQDVEHTYQYILKNTSEVNFDGYLVLSFGPKFDQEDLVILDVPDKNIEVLDERVVIRIYLVAGSEDALTIQGKSSKVVLSDQNGYNYSLVLKKPLGYSYQETFNLEFPQSLRIISGGERGQMEGNRILFSSEVVEDEAIELKFTTL